MPFETREQIYGLVVEVHLSKILGTDDRNSSWHFRGRKDSPKQDLFNRRLQYLPGFLFQHHPPKMVRFGHDAFDLKECFSRLSTRSQIAFPLRLTSRTLQTELDDVLLRRCDFVSNCRKRVGSVP